MLRVLSRWKWGLNQVRRELHEGEYERAWSGIEERTGLTHELSIYVDEGRGKPNGHVWIGLSDGRKTHYHGFYPETILGGLPAVWKPRQVRDDSGRVTASQWDVRRTYRINEESYRRALDAINAWQNRDQERWTASPTAGISRKELQGRLAQARIYHGISNNPAGLDPKFSVPASWPDLIPGVDARHCACQERGVEESEDENHS